MEDVKECPVCLECFDQYQKRKINLETCEHSVCFNCIRLMVINKEKKQWFHKCPLCRVNFTQQELQRYKITYKNENASQELDKLINNIGRINPMMGDVIRSMRNVPDIVEQANAINMFFSGQISYAEMRALAG